LCLNRREFEKRDFMALGKDREYLTVSFEHSKELHVFRKV
jgi:hypothetical protein